MAEDGTVRNDSKKEKSPASNNVEQAAKTNEKVVFIGQKPVKNYVIACLMHFNAGARTITLKARGRAICKAVDTFELLRRSFLKDVNLKNISMSTEQVTREGGKQANVSTIELTVTH